MTTHRIWNESVLHTYSNLQNFFSSSEAIGEVLSQKDKICSKTFIPYGTNLDCKWQVCQIATAPFRYLVALMLQTVSIISVPLGARGFSKQMKRNAEWLKGGFNGYTNDATKLFLLKSSINSPNAKAQALNATPSIPESRITDPRVKKRTLCDAYHAVIFNHQHICRGMSTWFIYLYLNTKDQFSDPRSHMRTLGKQFVSGGGMDSTLLQSLYTCKGKILGLKIGTQPIHSRNQDYTFSFKRFCPEWYSNPQQMVEEMQNLPPGAYRAFLPKHDTAYIKIDNNLGFFFDPNRGITEINGSQQGEKLYELLSSSLATTHEMEVPEYNKIVFTPVTKR